MQSSIDSGRKSL